MLFKNKTQNYKLVLLFLFSSLFSSIARTEGTWETVKPVSSGIYYYSIFADDFSETRKMILIK